MHDNQSIMELFPMAALIDLRTEYLRSNNYHCVAVTGFIPSVTEAPNQCRIDKGFEVPKETRSRFGSHEYTIIFAMGWIP